MTDTPEPEIANVTSPRARAIAISVLLAGAVCAGMGQTIVFSVLPPLARDLGLSDRQVVVIFMLSAICWVTLGPRWGRISDQRGRKPFILIGLIGFALSMALFGGAIRLGLVGVLSGAPLYALLIGTRLLYGLLGSASPPAAQAYIADRTTAIDRTAGIAGFSAAFGFGAMLGPGFGAAAAAIDPVAPFFAISVLAGVMSIIVYLYLPERTRPTEREQPAKLKITDKRLRPFLIFGLAFGVINAIPMQTIAFYFIDVLGFSTKEAPQFVGIGLTGGAMASLFAQLVIVQRFRLSPKMLMRLAPIMVLSGHCLIWTSSALGPVFFGMMLAGFGSGMAIPGFNAAASLAVNADEQGGAIGLAGAAGASGFIIAPLLGIWLYGIMPQLAYMFTSFLAVGLIIFAFVNREIAAATPVVNVTDEAAEKPASSPYQ